jgi:hypothetical protein
MGREGEEGVGTERKGRDEEVCEGRETGTVQYGILQHRKQPWSILLHTCMLHSICSLPFMHTLRPSPHIQRSTAQHCTAMYRAARNQ